MAPLLFDYLRKPHCEPYRGEPFVRLKAQRRAGYRVGHFGTPRKRQVKVGLFPVPEFPFRGAELVCVAEALDTLSAGVFVLRQKKAVAKVAVPRVE